MTAPRALAPRIADTLALLAAPGTDVWVATASGDGPHLVPLSLCWTGTVVVIAVEPGTRTADNTAPGARVRLAAGTTDDVVMIDAVVERVDSAADVDTSLADSYLLQAGWDPRRESDAFRYITLRPLRVQAWRGVGEIGGRTLMRDGRWLA